MMSPDRQRKLDLLLFVTSLGLVTLMLIGFFLKVVFI